MPQENSQVIYGWAGESKPVKIEEGTDNEKNLVDYEHFRDSMRAAEEAMAQKITQDNSDVQRVQGIINDEGLATLDTGTATVADCAAEINKIYNILTNLVLQSKDRG